MSAVLLGVAAHALDLVDRSKRGRLVDVDRASRSRGPALPDFVAAARIEDALDLLLEDVVVDAGAEHVVVALAELEALGAAEHLGERDRRRRTARRSRASGS